MDRRFAPLLLLLLVGADVQCGPTAQEVGTTVLVSAPIVHAITMAVLWGLCALWRRREPQLRFPWRPHVGIVAGLGVLGLAWAEAIEPELILAAVWIFGTAYLAVTLFTWRIWFAIRRDGRAFLLPSLVAIVLTLGPALALATGRYEDHITAIDVALLGWSLVGGWGVTPAALLLAWLAEGWWKRRRS